MMLLPSALNRAPGSAAMRLSQPSLSARRSTIFSRVWLWVTFGRHCRQSRSAGCKSGLYVGRNTNTTRPAKSFRAVRTIPVLPTRWLFALSVRTTAILPRPMDRSAHSPNVAQNCLASRFSSVRHNSTPAAKSIAAETERFSLVPGAFTFNCSPRTIQVRVREGNSARSASSWGYRSAWPLMRSPQAQSIASRLAGSITSWRMAAKGVEASGEGAGVWAPALRSASIPSFFGHSPLAPRPCGGPSKLGDGKRSPRVPGHAARCARPQQSRSFPPSTWPEAVQSRWDVAPHKPAALASSPRPAPFARQDLPWHEGPSAIGDAAKQPARPVDTAPRCARQLAGSSAPLWQPVPGFPVGRPARRYDCAAGPDVSWHSDNRVPGPRFLRRSRVAYPKRTRVRSPGSRRGTPFPAVINSTGYTYMFHYLGRII